jgi:hypothetical protein
MQTIEACEGGKISKEVLNIEDIGKLYSILGQLVCNDSINEEMRLQILNWAIERLVQ